MVAAKTATTATVILRAKFFLINVLYLSCGRQQRFDAMCECLDALRSVEYCDPAGVALRECVISVSDTLKKSDIRLFHSVLRPAGGAATSETLVNAYIDEQREVRSDSMRRYFVQGEDALDIETAAKTLICGCGIEKTIRNDMLPPIQCRNDDFMHKLGSGGGKEKQLRYRVHGVMLCVQQQGADPLRKHGAAGFSYENTVLASFLKTAGQSLDLRSFTGKIYSFEADEHSGLMLDAFQARGW
jgi:hypothetical protein